MALLDFLRSKLDSQSRSVSETGAIRKIIESLDQLDPQKAKFIAAFAYLLSRAARADLNISPEETRAMEQIVMKHASLAEQQAVLVIQMAKTQNILFGGTENFLVTREFNALASHQEKLHLLDCIYAVAAADASVSIIEDNEVRQIADELRIEHRDLISIRSKYRDQLAVLKNSNAPT